MMFAESENDPQRAVFSIKKVAEDYRMELSAKKSKTIAFEGGKASRNKIVYKNDGLKQVNNIIRGSERSQSKNFQIPSGNMSTKQSLTDKECRTSWLTRFCSMAARFGH